MPVVTFDYNIDDIISKVMSFSESEPPKFPFSYELIGYGSNSILNMGSVFILNLG
jgi:hypothetical protein